MNDSKKTYRIRYEYYFEDQSCKKFDIFLDSVEIMMIPPEKETFPEWTRLQNHQCSNCPLTPDGHPYCPVAVNISEVVESCNEMLSYDKCTVYCITRERTYVKESTPIQEGLFSILGLIMATSGCPIMDFFRPMARFHLPFSTIQESMIRSTSLYLLRQYFVNKRGKRPDLELKDLNQIYQKVLLVNEGILSRMRDVTIRDANKNAIMGFHSLSQLFTMEIDQKLSKLEYLFITDTHI